MEPLQFAYWLQGYFEVAEPTFLGEKEITIIRQHLDTIFNKVTEGYTPLNTIYTGPSRGVQGLCGIPKSDKVTSEVKIEPLSLEELLSKYTPPIDDLADDPVSWKDKKFDDENLSFEESSDIGWDYLSKLNIKSSESPKNTIEKLVY